MNHMDALSYDLPYRLLEESRKLWDHAVSDKLVYDLNPFQVTLNSPIGIAKDYLQGHVWIEVHMTFQDSLEGEGDCHYAATIEACSFHDVPRQFEVDNSTVHRDSHVLVDVAHLVEAPKKMALDGRGIPSTVRLKRLDDRHCICGYTKGLIPKPGCIGLLKNRELGVLGIGLTQFCETPDKLVQRCPQTVENLSGNERNPIRSIRDLDSNAAQLIFEIVLGVESAGLRFVENTQFLPQSVKMFLRPGGLQIGVSQAHDRKAYSNPARQFEEVT